MINKMSANISNSFNKWNNQTLDKIPNNLQILGFIWKWAVFGVRMIQNHNQLSGRQVPNKVSVSKHENIDYLHTKPKIYTLLGRLSKVWSFRF